jgi:hypothetical protein
MVNSLVIVNRKLLIFAFANLGVWGMFGQDDQQQQGFGGQQDDHQQSQASYMDGISDASQPQVDEAPVAVQDSPALAQPAQDDSSVSVTPAPVAQNDLLDIKQQALSQLVPLVSHLDQSPEDKFKTTMMMIQASDDSSLIKVAYEAAQQIGDEAEKAQALLDIVNEINYFTSSN